MSNEVRKFETGATRSGDTGRYDPEGFLSPIVIERYSEYLNKHRTQPDGSIRESDNWQKGIPLHVYAKGLWRHFLHFWTRHRGFVPKDSGAAVDIEEDLCAIIFGAQGYLFEILKFKYQTLDKPSIGGPEPYGTAISGCENTWGTSPLYKAGLGDSQDALTFGPLSSAWRPADGSQSLLDPDTVIMVHLRDGRILKGKASLWCWGKLPLEHNGSEIFYYRPLAP